MPVGALPEPRVALPVDWPVPAPWRVLRSALPDASDAVPDDVLWDVDEFDDVPDADDSDDVAELVDVDELEELDDFDESLDERPTRGAVGGGPPTRIGPAGGSELGSTFSALAVGFVPDLQRERGALHAGRRDAVLLQCV